MALVIDGVFFQLAQSGIARVWRAMLPLLAQRIDMPIVFLDRGGVTAQFDNIEVIPFAGYKSKFNANDSQLLEQVCQHYGAKAFVSTYYTTPMETPSLLLVYDMIPEKFGFDMTARDWREKEIAIAHARRHICISQNTRKDLRAFYPELPESTTTVAHCGVDPAVFRPRSDSDVRAMRSRLGLARPYFIFVGSREQHKNYKNASVFFDAVATMPSVEFDVLCVGGEKTLPSCAADGNRHRMVRVDLDDEQLAVAYSGAAALVYPSLYEGFGLPVAEAMACDCPVISTVHGSLVEVAGDATLKISGHDASEMTTALRRVQERAVREQLIERGRAQSAQFRWEIMADEIARTVKALAAENDAGIHADFYARWAQLRQLQGEVDVTV